MKHTLFALLDTPEEVAAVVSELEAVGTPKAHCSVVVHRGALERQPSSEQALFETGALTMTARLTALGAAIGVAVGAFAAGPLGLLAAGPIGAMLLTTATGTLGGALAGVLGGASDADPTLHRLAAELGEGRVLLAIQAPTLDAVERAEHLLHANHARIVHRHLIGSMTAAEEREVTSPKAP